MVDVGSSSLHPTTITTSPPRHHEGRAHAVPLPSPEGCGPAVVRLDGGITQGKEDTNGGPMKWEAHAVRHDKPRRGHDHATGTRRGDDARGPERRKGSPPRKWA